MLQDDYNQEVKDAWATAFNIIKNVTQGRITESNLHRYVKDINHRDLVMEDVDNQKVQTQKSNE